MNSQGGNSFAVEKKCAVCGKSFCRASFSDYAWKLGEKVYCSYGCFRVDERKQLAKLNRKILRRA